MLDSFIKGNEMKLGVFVGSFDPIHLGHINVMDYLIDNNYLDKIVILPTLEYWEKKNITSVDTRFEMINLIERDYLIVDNQNNKYRYTIDILNKLQEIYNNDELYLIISADNIVSFDKWYKVDEILAKYKVIVLNRDNIDILKYIEKYKDKDNFIVIQDYPFINISSTTLRQKIKEKYLDKKVYKYIMKKHLYNN